ncbi:isochorismate synthase [Pararhizobium sp. LjRoot238]|uniref:isochorismate synthase n=1 Tax=Pararhizobium sp. LjRoot238 TaxID=3342293 RepID=UPI003ECF9ED6
MANPMIWIDEDAQTQAPSARQVPYVLKTAGETLLALGQNALLPQGPLAELSERTARFFRDHSEGPDMLVGALPFEPSASAHLFQPERVLRVQGRHDLGAVPGLGGAQPQAGPARILSVTADPDPEIFAAAVSAGLEAMEAAGADLRKIVLSRSLKISASRDFSAADLMRRLSGDDSVTVFATPLPPRGANGRTLIGATPELLVEKRGCSVVSHPLAGSARRHPDAAADRRSAAALLSSEKDRREHAMVVESIFDLLSPYCLDLSAPEGTGLRATASMWHLGTRIAGRLKDASMQSEYLAALLHPTPAVCGLPRAAAHSKIGELESHDRGFYAGAVGWCDSAGDGRWFVSIRCAEIEGCEARLYAGAGIVPGSTPEGEIAETAAKFRAMLDGFGIDGARYGI